MCSVHCLHEPKKPYVSLSLAVGNTFLILSNYKAKEQNCVSCVQFHTVTMFSFDSPQTFSSLCWLHIIIHVRFSLLRYAQEVKTVLAFLCFDPGSYIKLLPNIIEKNVSLKYGAILLWQAIQLPVSIRNVSINAAAPA